MAIVIIIIVIVIAIVGYLAYNHGSIYMTHTIIPIDKEGIPMIDMGMGEYKGDKTAKPKFRIVTYTSGDIPLDGGRLGYFSKTKSFNQVAFKIESGKGLVEIKAPVEGDPHVFYSEYAWF